MTDRLHPYIEQLGPVVAPEALQDGRAAGLAAHLSRGRHPEARHLACRRHGATGFETVLFEVVVARPQDLAAPIRREEPIALVFRGADEAPTVLAAREDFPETPHQNASPAGMPKAPCVDDRPWDEARSSWTPFSCVERVRWWLGAAASGDLSGTDQAVEPLFMHLGQELVVPRSALAGGARASTLAAYLPPVDHPRVLLARAGEAGPRMRQAKIRLVTVRLEPQVGGRIRSAPATVAELASELGPRGCDLLGLLRREAVEALQSREALGAKLVLLVVIPVVRAVGGPIELHDLKAFITVAGMGEVGVALGCLWPGDDAARPFVKIIVPADHRRGEEVRLEALRAVLDLDRELAAECAGRPAPDARKLVQVGAGAVGSHFALVLAREGAFEWTIADDDHLLPHNLARHALGRRWLGFPKAQALALEVGELLDDAGAARHLIARVGNRRASAEVDEALAAAELVVDTSASVSTARFLSDHAACRARRASVFLNPSGTAAVMLLEDAARTCRLDSLEAQYYRLLLRSPELRGHLAAPAEGLRYSGSCRAVTSRIPASSVAALSGLAARGFGRAVAVGEGDVRIWTMRDDGAVDVARIAPAPARRHEVGAWTVVLDDALAASLRAMRHASLPAETGGVLVGIVDAFRRAITLVEALPAPNDSAGSVSDFVRGTDGLSDQLRTVQETTRDQVRYAGEWHSHPRGHTARPSALDMRQLAYLRAELAREGLPPVMVIVGEGEIAVLSAEPDGSADRDASPGGVAGKG